MDCQFNLSKDSASDLERKLMVSEYYCIMKSKWEDIDYFR